MNPTNISLSKSLITPSYITLSQSSLNSFQNTLTLLLSQRQLLSSPLPSPTILHLLSTLSLMDTNNFPSKIGVGQRQSRIYSPLVQSRHYYMGHGIGRSGDIMANQPKAAGSSLLLQLTRYLTLSALKIMNYGFVEDVLLVPLATGMALTLALLTMKEMKPKAKYVIWSRIDQKTCLKCIQAANLVPIVVEGVIGREEGDQIGTNVEQIERQIQVLGVENVVAVFTTSSCFAPRVPDSLEAVAKVCLKYNVFHLLNNAYGLQCSKIAYAISQSIKIKLDCIVQSTDKNFMVPVGGSIIFTNTKQMLERITTKYPGRACGSPIVDLFITFLEMGKSNLKELYQKRKIDFKYTLEKAQQWAKTNNQRVLKTKGNTISIAITIGNIIKKNHTELGAILFSKRVMGHRVIVEKKEGEVFGVKFKNYGSHCEGYKWLPYINIACAIGTERREIEEFFEKLDEAIKEIRKREKRAEREKEARKEEEKVENNVKVQMKEYEEDVELAQFIELVQEKQKCQIEVLKEFQLKQNEQKIEDNQINNKN